MQGKKGLEKRKTRAHLDKTPPKRRQKPRERCSDDAGRKEHRKKRKTAKKKKHHAGDGINHVFSKQHSQLRHRAMETPLPSLSHYAQPTCDVVTGLHNCPYNVGISPRTCQDLNPKIYYDTTRSLTSPEPVIRPGTDLTR